MGTSKGPKREPKYRLKPRVADTTPAPAPAPTPPAPTPPSKLPIDRYLMTFAKVHDQATGTQLPIDPTRVDPFLQSTIFHYFSNTPRTPQGKTKWLVLLGSRQSGKSTITAACNYARAAMNPNFDATTIADIQKRAVYLFQRVQLTHRSIPEPVRSATFNVREVRQLSFTNGAMMRVLSADNIGEGVGRAPDSVHMSEVPLWKDAEGFWSYLWPAIVNRDHCTVVLESTPYPMHHASSAWYRSTCSSARQGKGRFVYTFSPFFNSRLNRRPWDPHSKPTTEEQRLLDKYGPHGMDLENLAFRREALEVDDKIRRHPELFGVFYPFDDLTCWLSSAGATIPAHAMARHLNKVLVPWGQTDTYREFLEPKPGVTYVIGVDPAGWTGGDNAAFQVLEVWADKIEQVAVFATNTLSPPEVTQALIKTGKRYNNALIAVESNGVGMGVLSPLVEKKYPNIYYHNAVTATSPTPADKPGIPASEKSIEEAMAALIDALLDTLELHDQETVEQLQTYKNDKNIQTSQKTLILTQDVGRGRRKKHHWDRVSALMWGVLVARTCAKRFSPEGRAKQLRSTEQETTYDLNTVNGMKEYSAAVRKHRKQAKDAKEAARRGQRRRRRRARKK